MIDKIAQASGLRLFSLKGPYFAFAKQFWAHMLENWKVSHSNQVQECWQIRQTQHGQF